MEQYIGVDLHKQFFQACSITSTGARAWEMRFPRTEGGLALFCARCGPQTAVAVEACGPTWAFVDAIAPTGTTVCVVDPRKTRLKAGFAAKTDRLDARRLADALRRDSVVSVYVPPPAIRELREVCRGRHQVIRLRTRVAQMIRALLLRSGGPDVPVRRVFSPRGLAWLEEVQLPPDAAASLTRLRHVLTAIHAEAAAAESVVARARGGRSDRPRARHDGRHRAGPRAHVARGNRRRAALSARRGARQLCGPRAARRRERGSVLERPNHP